MERLFHRRSALMLLTAVNFGIRSKGETMASSVEEVCKEYVSAWQRKSVQALQAVTAPEIEFKSPTATTKGQAAFLQAVGRFLPLVERVDLRARFVSGDQAMVAYDFVCREPVGISATAELIRVKNGLVEYSEIFFDARPFAALAKPQSPVNPPR